MVGLEFDKLEDGYTEKIRRWVPYYDALLEAMVVDLPPGFRPKTILDLGAGNGNATHMLLQVFPEADYVLVDASAKMLARCGERFGQTDQFIYKERYFQELTFLPESFDLIVAGLSLHHLTGEEKQVLFAHIRDWLRPGGIFTASDLYVDRKDAQAHAEALQEWEEVARSQGSTNEDWDYLMEHYDKYDRPDSFVDQLQWLRTAGFAQTAIVWVRGYWGTVRAIR